MERFNLIKDPWILVLVDEKGNTEEVSLENLFKNAHKYLRLAGETPAQDFATLRFLLSIIYTVFSRVDENGKVHDGIEIDEKLRQLGEIDEWNPGEYRNSLIKNWRDLWEAATFPEVLTDYLNKWIDRFYIEDDVYPFYQISKTNKEESKIPEGGEIKFKYINRLISESNNKIELFSPSNNDFKNSLSKSEIIRWLIAFQGFTGTGDKKKHPQLKGAASKGWLLGLGGIYLSGKNLKETLLLNYVIPEDPSSQKPIWEKEWKEKERSLLLARPDNIAELYTFHSRLIMFDSGNSGCDSVRAIQLPGIDPKEYFTEPMTLWRFGKSGEDKDHYVPRQHSPEKSFWRNIGSLTLTSNTNEKHHQPEIINWHNFLIEEGIIKSFNITIHSVGLSYNRDASTMPNDEIYDEINLNSEILADVSESGWIPRIVDEIEVTSKVIDGCLGKFVSDIKEIRNISISNFNEQVKQEAYYLIDSHFKEWLSELRAEDPKEIKTGEWREKLQSIILKHAETLVKNPVNRDIKGVEFEDKKGVTKTKNIFTAYNYFKYSLNKVLQI